MLFRIHWTLMLHLYNEDSSLKLRLVSRMRISTISGVFKPVYSLSFLCLCNARMLNYESFPDKVRLMNKKSQNMAVPDFPHCTQTFFSVETPLQNTLVITCPEKENPTHILDLHVRSGAGHQLPAVAQRCLNFCICDLEENPWWDVTDSKTR